MRYTFGDTITAGERLEKIAGFFNPLAREFMEPYLDEPCVSVADLGCGPGYSTQMLAQTTEAEHVEGIDRSAAFLQQARSNFPALQFRQADVTTLDPSQKYDLIYCRFLLSHLIHLQDIIATWLNCLHPKGKLVLDELEDVITDKPIFRNYLAISAALVGSQGAELYVGKLLNEAVGKFTVVTNRSDLIPVWDCTAAAWFYGNTIGPWKEEPFIRKSIPENEVEEIEQALSEIVHEGTYQSNITWKMKRIILTH